MSLIDRSLQRLRIVTKVLLFVVPLVALIAGIGLVGYFTASTLNGHMTVTRQTIASLSDFQNLRAGLQAFIDKPAATARDELLVRIDEQDAGIRTLEDLLEPASEKEKIVAVVGLGEKMRAALDGLWAIEAERLNVSASLDAALADMFVQSDAARKQVDVIRKEASTKESFAKALLFDAAAYQGLSERIKKFRLPVTMAVAPEAKIEQAIKYLPHLIKQIGEAEKIVSPKVLAEIDSLKVEVQKIEQVLAGEGDATAKKNKFIPVLSKLSKFEADFLKAANKNSETAAKRFVTMDSDIVLLKTLIETMASTFKTLDDTRLHISELYRDPSKETRAVVLSDVALVRDNARKLAQYGSKNAALRDLAEKLKPSFAAIAEGTKELLAADESWELGKTQASALVADASQTLENFVSRAQEVGKQDSQRSADVSIIAMVAGTLLAIIGGLMLIETLRGPLKRVTETMTRLANGDLEVAIEGRNRGDEIGDMVRSVAVFRDHAVENVRLEREAEAARTLSAEEEARRSSERARIEAEQMEALTALSDVLAKLADGNLEEGMAENLSADYVVMARTYNNAVEALRATLIDVRVVTDEITGGTSNLASSADDLARRTEQQAAALEQSSRALGKLTEIVRSTAESARKTTVSVDETHNYARHSGTGRIQGDRRHGCNQRVVREDFHDHQRHRRNRLPDQSSGAQCRCRGGTGRGCWSRLCRRRTGSARTGPALRRGRPRDQGADFGKLDAGSRRRGTGEGNRQGTDCHQRAYLDDPPAGEQYRIGCRRSVSRSQRGQPGRAGGRADHPAECCHGRGEYSRNPRASPPG